MASFRVDERTGAPEGLWYETAMYSVLDYGRMAADGVRIDAYARAIASTVKPGSVVVDLGAGTGIFSLLAARAGAARVHAIDVNPAVLLVSDLARENGCSAQIVVHHGSSLELTLPEPADVIISDMRGNTPLNGDHLEVIRDARQRFLKRGGALIPASDELFVQVVESAALAARMEQGWNGLERLGFSARSLRHSVQNAVYDDRAASLAASDALTPAGSWAKIDYATFDEEVFEGTVGLPIVRQGTAHGLVVWFQAKVYGDIDYRSAPGWALAYARMFVPLSEPVDVVAGAHVQITMRADARGDRWAWDTTFAGRTALRQSTFLGVPTDPTELVRLASNHAPSLSLRGTRLASLLGAMNGARTIAELSESIDQSRGRGAALHEVREAVRAYAR